MFPMYLHTSCFRESGWRTVLSEVEIVAAGYVTNQSCWHLEIGRVRLDGWMAKWRDSLCRDVTPCTGAGMQPVFSGSRSDHDVWTLDNRLNWRGQMQSRTHRMSVMV
jgi:hypothetical protein